MFLILLLLVTLFYYCGCRNLNYWKKRGVKHDPPIIYFGNNLKQFMQRSSMAMMATKAYFKYPEEKVVGFYRGLSPELIIRDPELIKRVLITDFQHFHARGLNPHRIVVEPLLKNLFFIEGDLWRLLRQRFTPAFSSGKLKGMFKHITERTEKLQCIAEQIATYDVYDMRELMARYTTEFIGVCGFGLDMDCLNEENSQFRKLGKRIFTRTIRDGIVAGLKFIFPEMFKNFTLLSPEIEESMVYLVTSVMKQRNYKPSGKNDFIDLLLEVKKNNIMIGESIEKKNPDGSPTMIEIEITEMLLIAQVFVFFGAGFETSSGTSSYTLHQLAFNPDYQVKVIKEIDRVLAKYNNKITYDAIKEMKFLEMAFYEAMRMYPSVGYLYRTCVSSEYTFPEINLTINDGVNVMIPIQALHNDEKYFHKPEKFDPDRFHDDNNELKKFVYMPFGEGPRACVGARLGQMQSMAGIAAILQKFTVEPAACSVRNPPPDPTGIVSENFLGGLPLKLRKREQFNT